MDIDQFDTASRRVIWGALGVAVSAPAVWIWATWVARNDARVMHDMERRAAIELCSKQAGVAVEVLNSQTIHCVSGSGRRLTAPLAHPLKGSR